MAQNKDGGQQQKRRPGRPPSKIPLDRTLDAIQSVTHQMFPQ